MRSTPDFVAATGLAIGGAFGLAGTFVASDALRETLWTIDSVALVVATALLTMKYQWLGNDCVAAGFLTFLAGESLLLAGNAAGLEASVPSYVGGISLWAAALVMVSAPNTFALWMRLTAVVAACCSRVGLHDPLGRAFAADVVALARRRLSFPGPHLHRLDLDTCAARAVSGKQRRYIGGWGNFKLRKYVLLFLGLCIDFVWINAAVVLADRLFPGVAEAIIGQPTSWAALTVLTLGLLSLARVANASVGEWLLSYALAEQAARARQWANLLLGTLGFVSGIWYLLRLTEPSDGMPFLFMVEDTPMKIAAVALHSTLYSWCGVMLLRLEPRAKLYNALLFASTLPLAAINQMFSHDALLASIMARANSQGRPFTMEKAELYARLSIYYAILLVVVMLAILYFCRERPAASVERSLEGSPSGRA
ncbi:hypothetical protein [Mesorhizobium sp. f-mel]